MPRFRMTARRWFWGMMAVVGLWLVVGTRMEAGGGGGVSGKGMGLVAAPLMPLSVPLGAIQNRFDKGAAEIIHPTAKGEDSAQLRQRNSQLENQTHILLARVEYLEKELAHRNAVIQYTRLRDEDLLPARVTARGVSGGMDTCVINVDANKVMVGQIVEWDFVPVGRIIAVTPKFSTVRLITDPDRSMRINVRLVRLAPSGAYMEIANNCQVRGMGNGQLVCDTVAAVGTIAPQVGDVVLVNDSDWASVMGWRLGEVEEVARSEKQNLRYELKIKPRVTPGLVSWVYVVLK